MPRQGGISSPPQADPQLCSCTQDKFVMVLAPGPFAALRAGTRICSQLKSVYLDSFLASINFVPRHCTSAHLRNYWHRDNFLVTYELCTASAPAPKKLCTWMAKTRAKPSLHRDKFLAPLTRGIRILPGAVVGLRLLKHTAGPLGVTRERNKHGSLYSDKFQFYYLYGITNCDTI